MRSKAKPRARGSSRPLSVSRNWTMPCAMIWEFGDRGGRRKSARMMADGRREWQPNVYLAFADFRARPASDLLSRVRIDAVPGSI